MHYVIALAGDHAGFGATKIYKALWFAEGPGGPVRYFVFDRIRTVGMPRVECFWSISPAW